LDIESDGKELCGGRQSLPGDKVY